MRPLLQSLLFAALIGASQQAQAQAQSNPINQPPEESPSGRSTITIPAGTKMAVALTSPIWSKTAKPGDGVYSAAAFPVAINNRMVIPPGTYVEGKLDAMTVPTGRSSFAEFQMHFMKLIFANGYVANLENVADENAQIKDAGIAVAAAMVYVEVSSRSDVLLDNGSQFEIILQQPVTLDGFAVAAAARLAKPPQIMKVKSATRCVPIPATPGTEPTVIPGSPGSPGTPDTVIPGGPGQPPTVIPGIPPTPGTAPTVIGGSSGSPGVACPGPPIVTSVPNGHDVHTKSLLLNDSVQIAGAKLSAGRYQLRWSGLGPTVTVDFLQNQKVITHAHARVLLLDRKSANDDVKTHVNSDGSLSLEAVLFSGESFALSFE